MSHCTFKKFKNGYQSWPTDPHPQPHHPQPTTTTHHPTPPHHQPNPQPPTTNPPPQPPTTHNHPPPTTTNHPHPTHTHLTHNPHPQTHPPITPPTRPHNPHPHPPPHPPHTHPPSPPTPVLYFIVYWWFGITFYWPTTLYKKGQWHFVVRRESMMRNHLSESVISVNEPYKWCWLANIALLEFYEYFNDI